MWSHMEVVKDYPEYKYYPWQVLKFSIEQSTIHLLETGLYSDISIILDQTKDKIQAHKLILRSRSSVFDKLIQQIESNTTNDPNFEPTLHVPDVELKHFQFFLEFLYADIFPDITENEEPPIDSIGAAYVLGKKFDVEELVNKCIDGLKNALEFTSTSPIKIYQMSKTLLKCEELEQSALISIQDKASTAFLKDKYFLTLDISTICTFLALDDLKIKEVDAFHGVIRWAEHQCQLNDLPPTTSNFRKLANEALLLIRFPTMCLNEFSEEVVTKHEGLLSEAEIIQILFLLAGTDKTIYRPSTTPSNIGNDFQSAMTGNCLIPRNYNKVEFVKHPPSDGEFESDEDEAETSEEELDELEEPVPDYLLLEELSEHESGSDYYSDSNWETDWESEGDEDAVSTSDQSDEDDQESYEDES